MIYFRRRGVLIYETPGGIMLVHDGGVVTLPGGKAKRNETRKKAALREMQEETGIKIPDAKLLFSYSGIVQKDKHGRGYFRDMTKVFYARGENFPEEKKSRKVLYLNYNSGLPEYTQDTRNILKRFYDIKSTIFTT